MPSKFGAVKGNDKKAIDLVIPDIVLDQPKEIVIKKGKKKTYIIEKYTNLYCYYRFIQPTKNSSKR